MLSGAGFSCWIEIDRNNRWTPVDEYSITSESPLHHNCLIESEPGLQWRLGLRLLICLASSCSTNGWILSDSFCMTAWKAVDTNDPQFPDTDISVVCFVDGQQIASRNFWRGDLPQFEAFHQTRDSEDHKKIRNFYFSEVCAELVIIVRHLNHSPDHPHGA